MSKTLLDFEKTIDKVSQLKEIHSSLLMEPVEEGKWSIRDIVAHLYYWDKFNLEEMVPEMSTGAVLPPFPDHDQHNQQAILSVTDYSPHFIIDLFINTRKELADNLSRLGKDVKLTIGKGKRQFSGESFIKIFVKHDTHHLKQIQKKLKIDN